MAETRANKLIDTIVRSNQSRARKDISQWRSALQAAESVTNPKRTLLYGIYDEILIDAHLSHELQKRTEAVLGCSFNMVDDSGQNNTEAVDELNKSWFIKLLRYAMESRYWGHSLVEIETLNEDGKVGNIKLVPRRHVRPEFGMILIRQSDEKGPIYKGNKQLEPWLFEFGDERNLGLMNQAVPHVLFKRFAQSAWSEYCEIFGMPLRVGKTNSQDSNSLNRLEFMLQDMATASYAVIDKDEEIEFVKGDASDGSVYEGLMNYSSNEISKLINGSVIGEASQDGSRAKEEVGKEIQEQITQADKMWLASTINEMIIPKLINLGYSFENLTFEWEVNKDIQDEWKIVNGVLNHYDVDPEYITETFGIPVTKKDNSTTVVGKANTGTDFF